MPKKYLTAQMTGAHGESLVAERVHAMGHVFQDTGGLEAGIDGYIEIRDPQTEEATNLNVAVQSKATSGRFTAETDSSFEYRVSEEDLRYWLSGNLPVLLVISRPGQGEAYFKDLKSYFDTPEKRAERKIRFDKKADCFDESASERITEAARPQSSGLFINPPPVEETLTTNLLPVRHYPETVYHAPTKYRDPGKIWSDAREKGIDIPGEWILRDERLWSIHDLSRGPWPNFCDAENAEPDELERWATTNDRDLKWRFIDLLQQCLRQRLRKIRVGYNSDKRLYYFWASRDLKPRRARYRYGGRQRPGPFAFKGYPEDADNPDDVHYYRHLAFSGRFRRLNREWHLEITPSYLFTSDGREDHPYGGEYISNIKRFEKHAAVRGRVEFWAAQLRKNDFESEYPHLSFHPLRSFTVGQGINDELWRSSSKSQGAKKQPSPDQKELFDQRG